MVTLIMVKKMQHGLCLPKKKKTLGHAPQLDPSSSSTALLVKYFLLLPPWQQVSHMQNCKSRVVQHVGTVYTQSPLTSIPFAQREFLSNSLT